jgi:general secretion pathway protein L
MAFSQFFQRLSRAGAAPSPQMAAVVAQMTGCLPAAAQRALARRQRQVLIEVTGATTAQCWHRVGAECSALGESDLSASVILPAAFTAVRRAAPHRIVLQLPAAAVVTRRVSLPVQVQNSLAQVLPHEIDRLSPFQATEVLFAYRLLPTAPAVSRLTLELALCRRDQVTRWLTQFAAAGAPVECVTWSGAWTDANLLPSAERPRPLRQRFTVTGGLLALTAVLALASGITPLWQLSQRAAAAEAELRQLRTQAIAVDDVRQELERARERSTALLRQQQAQPSLLELLRELTDRLPDDTWIQTLEYDNGLVELRGESGQATALIALLEQAASIEAVTFKSPVTQIARTGKERFNLSFRFMREEVAK